MVAMAFEKFTGEHPYLTFFLGLAAIHGVVTLVRGREPLPDFFGPHRGPLSPHAPHPFAPHPLASHLTGAPPPGSDYSFTRRPGYNGKDY